MDVLAYQSIALIALISVLGAAIADAGEAWMRPADTEEEA